ncbi:ABC transporter permease [Deinococcus pimensis]|uniref:ABC transporter permease n=1 Tax=Deinococcus pimensis TaxID=309888 RepID=UPI0004B2ADDF|nr:ABC transporter permease [Deinococcus pimensis]
MRRLRANKAAMGGLALVMMFALVAMFAPLLAPPTGNCARDLNVMSSRDVYSPVSRVFWKAVFSAPPSCYLVTRVSFSELPSPPRRAAPFGVSRGYDVYYGIVWGTRITLGLGVAICLINLLVGTVVGAVSGYYGGVVDLLIQRFIDVLFSFPGLVLTVVLVTILKPSLVTIVLAFTLTGWATYARIVRGDILRVRALEYVDAARALGARDARLIFRHVLPNAVASALTLVVLELGTVPLGVAALSFLGLGLPVGFADWGQLIGFARAWIQGPPGSPFGYWYITFFPAAAIVLYSLSWNLLGDGLRDAFDPRSR